MTKELTLKLSPGEVKVLAILLERYGDELSCKGCNDFSLSREGKLTLSEKVWLFDALRETFPRDMLEWDAVEDNVPDYLLLDLLQRKTESLL